MDIRRRTGVTFPALGEQPAENRWPGLWRGSTLLQCLSRRRRGRGTAYPAVWAAPRLPLPRTRFVLSPRCNSASSGLITPSQGRVTPLPGIRQGEIMAKGNVARTRNGGSTAADPEFVQLLTPEGERVDHPDYTVDFTDEEYRSLYRDLVVVRRLDAEATALQRQGELGIWASLLGQEAAQVGSGRALRTAGHGVPDLPRARRPLLPRHRPDHAAGPVPRRRPGRLGPERVQVQHVHDRHRRPDAARDRLRHGHHHGRQGRRRRRRGGDRLLRRRRHLPGRRERGVRLGQRLQRADRVLLPEQPVRDLRAAGAPDPGAAVSSAPPASASPASGSTATTCSPATR